MHEPGAETIGYKFAVIFPVEVVPQRPRQARRPEAHAGIRRLPRDLHSRRGEDCPWPCFPRSSRAVRLAGARRRAGARAAPAGEPARRRSRAAARNGEPRRRRAAPRDRGALPAAAAGAPMSSSRRRMGSTCRCRSALPDGGRRRRLRFEVDLSRGGNARELKGKTLTLTLVSDGAAKPPRTVPGTVRLASLSGLACDRQAHKLAAASQPCSRFNLCDSERITAMTIKVGDRLPDSTFMTMGPTAPPSRRRRPRCSAARRSRCSRCPAPTRPPATSSTWPASCRTTTS